MVDSTFDPTTFLNQQYEEANDTRLVPCPVGEYTALADKVDIVPWQSKDDPSKSGLKARILWDIQDDGVRSFLDREKVVVPQDVMLDLTDTGQLDMGKGKNTRLGRLREALDLNQPGEPFSFGLITGRVGLVNVSHRTGKEPEDVFAEVDRVAKPA